jgi:hypothetical protein
VRSHHGHGRGASRTGRASIRAALVPQSRRRAISLTTVAAAASVVVAGLVGVAPATAAQPAVGLGTAGAFGVLAGTTVTNTGPSVISGNVGVSPGAAVSGFPPGKVAGGVQHAADAAAQSAQDDLTTAYDSAAGRTPATAVDDEIGGRTLLGGVYRHASGMGLTGTVTLDAENDPAAVFIFKAGSTLITAANSRVRLVNGAQPCNVFWQVGSSATLGTATSFVGTVLALTSVSLRTGSTVTGRILARNGAVTLDSNVIRRPGCNMAWTPPDDDATPEDGDGETTTGGEDDETGGSTTSEGTIKVDTTTAGNGTPGVRAPREPAGPTTDFSTPRIPAGYPRTGFGGSS